MDKAEKQKDRTKTRMEILDAVGRVLARSGFRGIGINAIAREAWTKF